MFSESLVRQIKASGVVAVVVIDEVSAAVPLANALLRGGISAIELTLRTPVGLDALRAIKTELPDMLAGVGTILTERQVEESKAAGASFAVAPHCDPKIIGKALELGLPFAPGVMTPSDIGLAITAGCRILKYFPAESAGGLNHLKNISSPYAHTGLSYIPTGGINVNNFTTYLNFKSVIAVGGSWIAPQNLIREKSWKEITTLAQTATDRISQSDRHG